MCEFMYVWMHLWVYQAEISSELYTRVAVFRQICDLNGQMGVYLSKNSRLIHLEACFKAKYRRK